MAFVPPTPLSFSTTLTTPLPTTHRPPPPPPQPAHMSLKPPTAPATQSTPVSPFKTTLLNTIRPLDFGRRLLNNPLAQSEINTLAQQLEAQTPSPTPGAPPSLTAVWNILYTTSPSILRTNLPPPLRPVKITQQIDAARLYAKNEETFQIGPFRFTNAIEARLTPVTATRFDVKFLRFIVFGFLTINVENKPNFKGSLDTTYLDDDLRISRGNKGNLFILEKET